MIQGELKGSYDDVLSTTNDVFLPGRSKHCNTNGRSVWSVSETM